jgi:hypothetical protein
MRRGVDYPAQYLAQIRRPGDPLVARTAGGSAFMTGTTNLPYAKRLLAAWASPTLTERAALDDPPRPPVPYDRGIGVSDWWDRYSPSMGMASAVQDAPSWFARFGIGTAGLVIGTVVLLLALYLLARGD